MMKEVFSTYSEANRYLFFDKVNFLLMLVPVTIGITLYFFLGGWLFKGLLPQGEAWISSYFSSDVMGGVFYYLLVGFVSIFLYLLVSWTMVLLISLIASPFNDLISSRVEKLANGEVPQDISKGLSALVVKLAKTLTNEIKKVLMIILFTLFAFALNLLPVLVPVAFIITAILFSVQFVDYSWSRHELDSKRCFKDTRRNWIPYAFTGMGFLIVATIPVVNILLPAYATSYYTVLWTKLRKKILVNGSDAIDE